MIGVIVKYRDDYEGKGRSYSGGRIGITNKKTLAELQVLKNPCPFCHGPIWKGEDTIETLQGKSHANCPVEVFLRKFKNAGLMRMGARKVEFHKIPLILDFLSELFFIKIGRMIFSEKVITREEAIEINRKMEAFSWASNMFLEKRIGNCAN